MNCNSSALYLIIYLFSFSTWNLVESNETNDPNLPLMADAAPEAILAAPAEDLVAQLNDLKAENDLIGQIADLKAQNAELRAQLANPGLGARGAGLGGRGLARGVAARAPECGITNISSSGKVIATVTHNATAYVVDGKQHTLAFNQDTAQSNNNFNATPKRNSDVFMATPRPARVTIPAAEAAHAGDKAHAHAAPADAAKKAPAAKASKVRRDPNEVGIVNIESSDKVIATVASDSTVFAVDGDKHTLSLNQGTSLSDNNFEKGALPSADADHVVKNLRQQAAPEVQETPITVVDNGDEFSTVFTETPVFVA